MTKSHCGYDYKKNSQFDRYTCFQPHIGSRQLSYLKVYYTVFIRRLSAQPQISKHPPPTTTTTTTTTTKLKWMRRVDCYFHAAQSASLLFMTHL